MRIQRKWPEGTAGKMPQAWHSEALAGCATTPVPPAHQLSVIRALDRYSPPASHGHFVSLGT